MMDSTARDGYGFTPRVNHRLRNCAFGDHSPTPPLLFGDTVECEDGEDGSEGVEVDDLGGETQVLVADEGDVCAKRHAQVENLDGETQVVDCLNDGCGTCVVSVQGETQVLDGYEGETQVDCDNDDDVYCQETQRVLLGGETEVQDDVDCDITGTELGIVKDVFCDVATSLVDEKKQRQSHSKPMEQGSESLLATPPSTVERDPGYFQRSFTSIRAASLRASGLAARCKSLVKTTNDSSHASVEKKNKISVNAQTPGSAQEVDDDPSMGEAVCSVVRKLFTEEVHVENRIDGEEEARTPPLNLSDNDEEVAGLSYVDSQEPGDSTQANALDFVERFLKDNVSDMRLDVCNEPLRRTVSKPATCANSFSNFSKKPTTFKQLVDQPISFDWDEELEDEGGGDFFCRMKEKILNESGHKQRSAPQPQKSRRCGKLSGDKIDREKFHDKNTAIQSDSKLHLFKKRKDSVLDITEASTRNNVQMELNSELFTSGEKPTETAGCKIGIQEIFSVGLDTQIAAEAMEALCHGEPVSGNNFNANQGNHTSVSTVAVSKSTLSAKIPELEKKKLFSDRLANRKSKRKSHENKIVHKHETIRRNGISEVNGAHSVEEVCQFEVARRTTRSTVLNQRSVLINQPEVDIPKSINTETNIQFGVVVPKGKRSRKYSRLQNKSDGMHSNAGELKLGSRVVQEVSRSDVGSVADRSVARSAMVSCSLEAVNIDRDVSRNDISNHLSAKGSSVDIADCGMPVELVGAASKNQRRFKPAKSPQTTPNTNSKVDTARMGNSCRRQLPVNLSRSSLRKEISALLSNSPNSLSDLKRKRREMNEVRILFSNHLDPDVIKHQKKILARLGGSLAFSISDATHFVADSFIRTRNMLEAMALGKHIVTRLWLESCYQTSCLIDEKAYILRDAKKERELGFSMPDTLVQASIQPLLKNRNVIITPNSKPSKDIVATLVKAVHGRVIENFDYSFSKVRNVLVLSCVEDYSVCQTFLNEGVKVYSSELLLSGIVTQRLDYARHRLFEGHVTTAVSRRSRRGCR